MLAKIFEPFIEVMRLVNDAQRDSKSDITTGPHVISGVIALVYASYGTDVRTVD